MRTRLLAFVAVTVGCSPTSSSPGAADGSAYPFEAQPSLEAEAECVPGDVSAFQPTWYPPVGPHAGACTGAQLTAIASSCVDPSTSSSASCGAWQQDPANQGCNGCIFGPETGASQAVLLSASNP